MTAAPPARQQGDAYAAGWLTPVRAALLAWLVAEIFIFASQAQAIRLLALPDTDDAMRMAQVRDLIAGQGWWDLMQYRVNPVDGGVLMHWSRIVDAPLAAAILLLRPFAGQPLAEQIVMALWPPLHLLALTIVAAIGFGRLGDRRIALLAPAYVLLCGFILVQFRPLRIDHHGWQVFLAMLMLWQAMRPAGARAGALAGLFAAMLLAISIEGLPLAALFAGLAALRWALYGRTTDRDGFVAYMGALALGAMLFQFATRGPAGLTGHWCDSLSAPYIAAFVAATAATAGIVAVRPERRWVRFALLGAAALLAAAALVATAPECAAGPFASLDPLVDRYWYRHVLEGQPLWASKPHTAIYILVPSLLGLAGAVFGWRASADASTRRAWATLIVALAGATLLSLFVVRSVATAQLFAVPGCAWIGLAIWSRARALASPLPRIAGSVLAAATLPLLASLIVAVPLAAAFPMFESTSKSGESNRAGGGDCLDPAGIAALDRLAPTTILAPIDLGAPLIFWTRHSLVATPHHRNNAAMADTIRVFLGDPSEAEAMTRRRGATLIVVCRSANDFDTYRKARRDGLAARLYSGRPPDWLEPVPLGVSTGLMAWRVRPAGS